MAGGSGDLSNRGFRFCNLWIFGIVSLISDGREARISKGITFKTVIKILSARSMGSMATGKCN